MKLRPICVFLGGIAAGIVGTWLVLSYRNSTGLFVGDTGSAMTRPSHWARKIDRPPLRNFHQVAPGLYRGAQPDAAGFRELEKMGVRTVVNLRLTGSDRDELKGTALAYEHIAVEAWDLDEDEVVRFLRIARDPARAPLFVHCSHGADRTGAMCAVYRVVVQGWSKDDAIDEMTHGGFGYHVMWDDLLDYLRGLDVEKLRRLSAPPP